MRFNPDGRRIGVGSYSREVHICDASTGEEVLTLKGHTDAVLDVCFSSDGTKIASASRDNTVKIWGAGAGQELLIHPGIFWRFSGKDAQRLTQFEESGEHIDP